jgi:hypothetical protein
VTVITALAEVAKPVFWPLPADSDSTPKPDITAIFQVIHVHCGPAAPEYLSEFPETPPCAPYMAGEDITRKRAFT